MGLRNASDKEGRCGRTDRRTVGRVDACVDAPQLDAGPASAVRVRHPVARPHAAGTPRAAGSVYHTILIGKASKDGALLAGGVAQSLCRPAERRACSKL